LLADLYIKRGHDIQIAGTPVKEVEKGKIPSSVAILPTDFRGVKPKLLVKEGDIVKIGSPVFHCKSNPILTWPSPGGGTVKSIQYGPRRIIEKIEIELSEKEDFEKFNAYRFNEISSLERKDVIEILTKGQLFPFIRQRPFNKVADPNTIPRDIFISGWNTAPLSVDLDLALRRRLSPFQVGINVLKKLTDGDVHLSYHENTVSDTLLQLTGVKAHTLNGPHPAGNVGIQIHHFAPIGLNDLLWTVNAQDVVRIGNFLLTGQLDTTLFATVGGPSVAAPTHIKTRLGVPISTLIQNRLSEGRHRIISGDVLTGITSDSNGFLCFYDSTVSVVPEGEKREFLGMLKPGSAKTRYSLTNAFLGRKKERFNFSTLNNGSERYMVPINAWEDMLPMDILPNALYRAILAEDFEEMEQLGIYECDEEDFALCTFACPSKIDVGSAIRDGLDLMEKEG
tara:strand:+ start:4122 stop:5477 length:1356 start_codon:yes stop_codon:yes gene_type:complete